MIKKSEEQILFSETNIFDIKIKPWSFGTLFELSESLDILLDKANSKKILNTIFDKETVVSYIIIARIFTLANNEVLKIISKTINKSYDEILNFDMDKGIKIVLAIFNQNWDIIKNRTKIDTGNEEVKKSKSGIPLSEVFTTLLQNNIGKDLNDLKYEFSIDQIYMFYEKIKKIDMDKDHMQAIILANALTYTSQSHSRKDMNTKSNQWKRFMASLNFEKLKERTEKPKFKKVMGIFGSLGIPITRKKDK